MGSRGPISPQAVTYLGLSALKAGARGPPNPIKGDLGAYVLQVADAIAPNRKQRRPRLLTILDLPHFR